MILLVKRKNAALILLILFLSIAIFSIDGGVDPMTETTAKEKVGPVVVVDAGHGGEDPGKVSSFSSMAEKDLNLRIAQLLKDQLEQDGYTVIMTRTEDILNYSGATEIYQKRKQDLNARKKTIDESGADIAISIHMNAFTDSKYFGAQTFFPPSSTDSERLAKSLQNSLISGCDPTNKRTALLKKERIVLFRNLKVPTVLIECGFLSNEAEEAKLKTLEYQELIAKSIKQGIDSFFGKQ